MRRKEPPMPKTLIEPRELALHLADPDWAIVDCRFDLAVPAWGARAWQSAHIPHALYADLDRDLSGPVTPLSGRHPLPGVATLTSTFGRLGIDARVQVIAYDQGTGAFAARLWWLLRWLGHEKVAVLNGGWAAWQRAQLPVSNEATPRALRHFTPVVAADMLVTSAQLAAAVAAGSFEEATELLIDARSADRFAGENETLDSVAGHVPGARNRPFSGNLDAAGRFRDAAELERAWRATLGGRAPAALISMCGSGVTACHNLLALEAAGLPGARLYAGSWSEWIRDPARPVVRGAETADE
jgi:thiosulfate/3-mercaptopyruvate sulfurtransferase